MNTGKRLCIYFFYDRDGVADRYVDCYLGALRPFVDRLIVISNGALSEDSRALFKRHTDEVWERENRGYDVGAYKDALERVGWDELRRCREVILTNNSLMGPVHPFAEMFEAMEKRSELDFWGITAHGAPEDARSSDNPYGCIPEHIQSHFMVWRSRLLRSPELERYWNEMPEITSGRQAAARHEAYFTRYFAELGFSWDVYVRPAEGYLLSDNYLLMTPVEALRECRCPVFRRDSFFLPQSRYLEESSGEQPWELFEYLKNHTDYDTDLILENLVRSCYQDDIARTLRLQYVLPSRDLLGDGVSHSRVACVMHLYFMDLLEDSRHYASALPADADIYITTPKEENIPLITAVFSALPNRFEIRVIENRGRDVSSLLVGAADIQDKYDLICYFHDKKTTQHKPGTIGRSFAYKTSECVLSTSEYVRNVITTFERNPRLGLLSCPVPNHAIFLSTISKEWSVNFDNTVSLVKELGLRVPMSPAHPPMSPLGTIFWYRSAAMAPLFARKWRFEDFPAEPAGYDGTILHAVERAYSLTVQASGYFPGRVMPEHLAALELSNLSFYVAGYNRVRMENDIYGSFSEILAVEDRMLKAKKKSALNRLLLRIGFFDLLEKSKLALKRLLPEKAFAGVLRFKRDLFGQSELNSEWEGHDPFGRD